MNFKQSILRYWLAMNASAAQSAVHAGKAWLATAAAHAATTDAIPALNLNQFLAVLGFAFIVEIFNWLEAHPFIGLIPPASQLQKIIKEGMPQ